MTTTENTQEYGETEVVDLLSELLGGEDLELACETTVGTTVLEAADSLRGAGYMTSDDGLVLRMADGRTFLVTVKEDRR
jgi:hypothetical protein